MKRYSIFHAPLLAFGSKSFYRDVGRQWKGVAFGYLILLLVVCWIAPVASIHFGFSNWIDTEAPKIIEQIPAITFNNGKASIDEPQPYRIVDPESGTTNCGYRHDRKNQNSAPGQRQDTRDGR